MTDYFNDFRDRTRGGLDVFAEAKEVAVWVAEHELVYLPLAWGEG
jgi:hypothetical protein